MWDNKDENVIGPWIIHHGRKLTEFRGGGNDFPSIEVAAKSATLLANIGATNQTELTEKQVETIAKNIGLSVHLELPQILNILEQKRLIDRTDSALAVLGVTPHTAVKYATEIYFDKNPSEKEHAAIMVSELTSDAPKRHSEILERVGDISKLDCKEVLSFLSNIEYFGFIDFIKSRDEKLYFNGNLFRKEGVEKTFNILNRLTDVETQNMNDVIEKIDKFGCLEYTNFEKILGKILSEKLIASGMFDLNSISNEHGKHTFVTSPSAFHKFVSPVVDDCFDMAKALVAALTYGIRSRSPSKGKIQNIQALLQNLISGQEVGPATAIGNDYRVLELKRVIQLRRSNRYPNRFHMKLLKIEVGQLALVVLSKHLTTEYSDSTLFSEPMTSYFGPETNREIVRQNQGPESESSMHEDLEALRLE